MKAAYIDTLQEVISGDRRLSEDEALALFDAPLQVVGIAAHRIRKRLNNREQVTYLIDRNINYTNICRVRCAFCAFSRDEGSPDAYILSEAELDEKLDETVAAGGSGILLQGGCHPGLGLDFVIKIFTHIKSKYPSLRIHALSPPEIVHLAKIEGLSIDDVLRALIAAGLDSLPGGGAEILVDAIRREISPAKCTSDEWLDVMRIAHSMGLKTTATMMFGHIESRADRISHLARIRSLQDGTDGFAAFIPWTFQPGDTQLADRANPAGGVEYLRTLAISRIFLDNIQHIGASWLTQGLKIAGAALHFGADDIGSVMLEENVVAAAGCANHTNEAEIREIINTAGFVPRRRDAVYNYVDSA